MLNRRSDIGLLACFLCSVLLQPGEVAAGQATMIGVDSRMYVMLSSYYDPVEDDLLVNPSNILGLESTGLLAELSAQSQITWRDDYVVSVDASYQYSPGPGRQKQTDTHLSTNELFLDLFLKQRIYFKAGKKRESWAVGNIFCPIDIVNPPRNALDPSKSREGTYLVLVEMPLDASALSLAYFPRVEYDPDDRDGIPGRMDFEGGGLGLRSYFLIRGTDISFVYYRQERIPSLMKDYYGATFNRFFGYLGTYIEVLGHRGSDAEFVRKDEAGDYYFPDEEERVEAAKADERIFVDFSVGASYTFSDNTKIGIEYLRNADGYNDRELDQLHQFFIHDSALYLDTGDEKLKSKLLKGSEILQERLRCNYLALAIDRPNTLDDFFPRVHMVISLDDGSFVISGLVDYCVRDDTSLKLVVTRLVGRDGTEYGLRPARARATLELKYYW